MYADAVLIPHAGWQYSGRLAAQTLSSVDIPRRVVIFAPQHCGGGIDWAVAPNRYWQVPGKKIESDLEFAEAMINAVDYLDFDAVPHQQEHAIEVQLPIIARLSPQTKIIGIAMQRSYWKRLQTGAAQFAAFLEQLPAEERPLLVISSDMNHFANENATRRVDRLALDAIQQAVKTQNPEHALNIVDENQISMCGIIPCVFVMETLRCCGKLKNVTETGYTTSAEASGDTSRVVGYAGLIFNESTPKPTGCGSDHHRGGLTFLSV